MAQSLTPYARTWGAKARRVRVLHVFERACNLIDTESDVLSLVAPLIGNGPFNVVVPPIAFSRCISPSDPVIFTMQSVTIGDITVEITSAALWISRPAWDVVRQKRAALRNAIPRLRAQLQDLAPSDSLAALIVDLPPPLFETEKAILHMARAATQQLLAAIQCGDPLTAVKLLAGLGPGLTPSGDDFLVGCLLAIWACWPEAEARTICRSISDRAGSHTSPLSAAWLRAAARGECSQRWHTLFEQIITDDHLEIGDAATIIRQGHTSGADALTGFVMTLTALNG